MDDVDLKIYRAINECFSLGLPFTFCGPESISKWQFLGLLKGELSRKKEAEKLAALHVEKT
jgi:hypothetical protein